MFGGIEPGSFALGFYVGGIIGMLVTALCAASKRGDCVDKQ